MLYWAGLTKEQKTALLVEQTDREILARDLAAQRLRLEAEDKELSLQQPGRALMAKQIMEVSAEINDRAEKFLMGEPMKGAGFWGLPFTVLEADKLALIAMSGMLDACQSRMSLASVSMEIGRKVETEYHFNLLRKEAPKLLAVMQRRIKKWTPRQVRYATQKVEGLYKYWPAKTARWVGIELAEIVLATTPWFETAKIRGKKKHSSHTLIFTPEYAEYVLQQKSKDDYIVSPGGPMFIPPEDWGPGQRGGFLFSKMALIKPQNPWDHPTEDTPQLEHGPAVYEAINAVQRTPWRVNSRVLDVMLQCWKVNTGRWPDVPIQDQYPHYSKMEAYPEGADKEEKAAWRARASKVHQANYRMVSFRLAFLQIMHDAVGLRSRAAFYFPQQLDFRGRMYPVPPTFNPHGPDLARGLLEFADGKPIGAEGFAFLLIHVANMFGYDKVSLAERAKWTTHRFPSILQTANNPLSDPWWTYADKPWEALAAIFDLAGALRAGPARYEYVSHLPGQVDGTNSGLQHFSAMLRDAEGAHLTNLAPTSQPNDAYQKVADWVSRAVEEDCKALDTKYQIPVTPILLPDGREAWDVKTPPCLWWRGKITRKVLKRSTMTFVYGVTQRGIENYLVADGFTASMPDDFRASRYLRPIIWQALQETVKGAALAMKWLREIAAIANRHNVLLGWTTPSGFKVQMEYIMSQAVTLRTLTRSIRYMVPDADEDITVSEFRQRNAISPNFVHGNDAAHLTLTVQAGRIGGLEHWWVVHDCFGVHLADMGRLVRYLQGRFVQMYAGNVLQDFREEVGKMIPEELPEPPELGAFNIEDVLKANYAWA